MEIRIIKYRLELIIMISIIIIIIIMIIVKKLC